MKWGYIDKSDHVAIDFQFDHASQFREGFALVRVGDKHGFIDREVRIVIEPAFGDESQVFVDGSAMVQTENGTCGFINKAGQFVVDPVFDWAQPFSESIALVRIDERYGYIHRNGDILLQPEFELAGDFVNGYAPVCMEDDWYFVDRNGKRAFGPFEYASEFSAGIAQVRIDDRRTLLTTDGEVLPVNDVDWLSEYHSEDRIEFSLGDLYGYVDSGANTVIEPLFQEGSTFSDGLAGVKTNDRFGYIDQIGKFIIRPTFDEASTFHDGLARVKLSERIRYIDQSGETVLETPYNAYFPFREGLTPVYVEP
jgi:hypothetical protein